MSVLWKALIALVVALPLGAYAAGSLVASADDPPPNRQAIELREVGDNAGQATGDGRRKDRQDRSGEDDDDAEDEFERVNPDPEELAEEAEDAAEERRDRREDRRDDRRDQREDRRDDDSSGHGSGNDGDDGGGDSSGHGGGDD